MTVCGIEILSCHCQTTSLRQVRPLLYIERWATAAGAVDDSDDRSKMTLVDPGNVSLAHHGLHTERLNSAMCMSICEARAVLGHMRREEERLCGMRQDL